MFKRISALLLIFLFCVIPLSACGNASSPEESAQDAGSVSEDTEEASEEEIQSDGDYISRDEYGIPDDYSKVKIYDANYGFGDTQIVFAMDDDESIFYIIFSFEGNEHHMEGTIEEYICNVTNDTSGFVMTYIQSIYEDCMAQDAQWQTLN